MTEYRIESEIYRVIDKRADDPRVDVIADSRADWHEYEVQLVRVSDGQEVAQFDSYEECYNGVQWLTREDCENAISEIAAAVAEGNWADWFTIEEVQR